MTDLSPAAQAVLDAFAADNYGVWLEGDPDRIAAALEAVAEQLAVTDGECPGVTLWEKGFRAGAGGAYDALLAIAAELRAQ